MTLRSKHIVPIVLAVFILGIGGTMILNLWRTTSSKVPATYTSGEFAGEYNPADIRGSYSFGDIEEAFSVPVEALATAFAVEDAVNPAAFLCKSLEDLYGKTENGEVGTDSVRWFVALYTGLPYTPEEDTLLPSPSISVLRERLSEAELETVRTRTANLSALSEAPAADSQVANSQAAKQEAAESAAAGSAAADTHSETETGEVKGKTTFGELLSWGVSKETIEQILGLPVGKAGVTVRDYCTENGIEFSTVKDALQTAADQALSRQ
jgi:hypothetical protein